MAETDIARVVSLIMENPRLVEEIKALTAEDRENSESKEVAREEPVAAVEETVEEAAAIHTEHSRHPRRRGELLEALKPYMSDERRKAIDSFMAIADILDMMRAK